ncbi:TonB-dependent siderophore receptor [Xanthomonas melonis]|uniref:TonB-dependent siderophore receptor n=1 Tax=Xanthomonas melonis TaxID=56456 RepID=A0A2S7DGR7_9XANT|nr:TonB-dependent siderophore receptor [Xanthomonas melonis]MCC4598634.1 TonB-dependent siderophore receptor [Xanthomonas melonis]PPU73012.1 TonB-dependent siderophore receptor [Xanthomonas melonis]
MNAELLLPQRVALRPLAVALLLCLSLVSTAHADDGADASNARTLDAVTVQAERADGYTVRRSDTATRLALTPLETPQSVSSVSRQQMDDFALNNANDVLALAAGVNVERVETDRTYYTARGFDILNFQVDGLGLPFTTGLGEGDVDTALYQRIDVLRGANGLLSSTGNPSATVNFVRKRPTDALTGAVVLSGGSWSTYRVDADVSGPLTDSGNVRGRVVGAWQEGDSYLDRYSLDKKVFYGVLEADLTASTLLTLGASYQDNTPRGGMWGALPLYYTDGSPARYDRSTSTSADWSGWTSTDTRAFLEVQQALGGDWTLKGSLNYRRFDTEGDLFYVYGQPDRQTGLGLLAYPSFYSSQDRQKFADVYVSGTFALGGRRHDLVAGVNWAKVDTAQLSLYGRGIGTALPQLEDWTGAYPKPPFDAGTDGANFDMTRRTAYATARWSLGEQLTLITGINQTQVESNGASYGVQHRYDTDKTLPFVGAVYAFAPDYAMYASYAEIFNPQTQLDRNLQILAPITGSNAELGIKGQWLDGRINAAFALFRAKQDNTAEGDGSVGTLLVYRGIDATSTGYEAEVAGQLSAAWQLSGSYTQLGLKDDSGQNVRTYVPRRIAKLATTYRVPGIDRLKVGVNVRWQDAIARVQDSGPGVIRQPSYALVGAMAGYDVTPQFSATLNVNNLTDRRYINSLYWDQGYAGAGRNWWLSLNYRF